MTDAARSGARSVHGVMAAVFRAMLFDAGFDAATRTVVIDRPLGRIVDVPSEVTWATALAEMDHLEASAALSAAAPDLLAVARELIAPFADIDGGFLAEVADANPGDLHLIGGRGLTAHFARAILAGRAAVAQAEAR